VGETVVRRLADCKSSDCDVELSALQVLDCEVRILDDHTASIQAELRAKKPEIILRIAMFAGTVAAHSVHLNLQMISTQQQGASTTPMITKIMSAMWHQ
jgi:hypothetical protein